MTELEKLDYRAKLTQKINAMADAIGQVKAEGTNTFSNYNFVGYEQVNALIRSLSPVHKVNIMPSIIDSSEITYLNEKGKQVVRTTVKMSFLLTDTETGYCEERFSFGADQDTGGKSFGQAVTEAQKRFELKLFHISTKADVDPDSKNTEVVPAQQQPKAPATLSEYLIANKIDPMKALENLKHLENFGAEQLTSVEQLNTTQQEYLNTNINFFVNNCGV